MEHINSLKYLLLQLKSCDVGIRTYTLLHVIVRYLHYVWRCLYKAAVRVGRQAFAVYFTSKFI